MKDGNERNSVHWSFWIIGGVGLLFNLMGCMNYLFQMDTQSLETMPEVYRKLIETRPLWGTAAFGVAVFGGALGCVLLLLKKRVSLYVLFASLVGTAVAQLPVLGQADVPLEVWFGWLSQLVVGAFLVWYAKRATGLAWIS